VSKGVFPDITTSSSRRKTDFVGSDQNLVEDIPKEHALSGTNVIIGALRTAVGVAEQSGKAQTAAVLSVVC
jgi:hypothetical protein